MSLALALIGSALAGSGPVFSETRGVYDAPLSLELSPETDGDTVFYSLDGTDPTELYSAPLDITTTTVVRAVEVASDGTESDVETQTFLFPAAVAASPAMDASIAEDPVSGPILISSLSTLPSISISSLGAGKLTTSEAEVSLEWMDPDGDDEQVYCGARRIGGASLSYAKNSLRLVFRSDYGVSRLDLDLYGDDYTGVEPADHFDALTLRSGNHDTPFYLGAAGQYLRNFWMDETQLEQGRLAPHGRFAHVYLDGIYDGLYQVRERFNAAYMADYLGGDEEDYEAVNGGYPFDGDGSAWNAAQAASSSYVEASRWIDMPDFLDYMVLNYYAANAWDWSANHNWIAVGPTHADLGGFKFQSSDSDICLYYPYTTNILSNPGPSNVFANLLAEADPDFLVALEDAIHRNLEDDGPLTADSAAARYQRLADLAEDALVPESARWGGGWWQVDDEWVTERDYLLESWFPYRTDELLRQVREAGWYHLAAPELDTPPGVVAPGTTVTVSIPAGADGELWVAINGEDPRLSGGERSEAATGSEGAQSFELTHGTLLRARLRSGDTWGPLTEALYETDETPPILLNEWNAVADDETLESDDYDGAGEDEALGRLTGNGGDWFELLVLEDHLDIRGWTLTMQDQTGELGGLALSDDPLLSDLRSGTLITVAEDLPEDASYDPERGDWRFHLRASTLGSGRYVEAADFDVTQRDWRMTIWDADGAVRYGPVGETVAPTRGISSREVGLLARTPTDSLRRDDPFYEDGRASTYGYPNRWEGGEQDLSALRAVIPDEDPVSWETGETGLPGEGEGEGEAPADSASSPKPGGCGCESSNARAGWLGLLLLLPLYRRRRVLPLVALAACTGGPGSKKDASQADDSASDTGAPSVDTCYADRDGDGYGDPDDPLPGCARGVADSGDCDDLDDDVHPDADELCDDIDQDCDGQVDEDPVDGLPFYEDADGDGYGVDSVVLACALGDGAALYGGDCDDADPTISPGAEELCDEIDQDCDGTARDALGSSKACAGTSCQEIAAEGGATTGASWIYLPSGELMELWCDQDTDGGGWTLGFLRNSYTTGSQGDFGSGYQAPEELDVSPGQASHESELRRAWIDLNDYDWSELQLAAYDEGVETYRSRAISRDELRIDFGEDGYLLYGGASGYYWCGGDASYTDSGIGATDNPDGAPSDCKGHGSLGSGWDFSESAYPNAGLTLCGGDGSNWLAASWGGTWIGYGTAGGAQAIWVR